MEVKVERKYSIYLMPENGNEIIKLRREFFPHLKKEVGFSRSDISVRFVFSGELLDVVVISSRASRVKNLTLGQLEAADSEEIKNYLKIRYKTSIKGFTLFIEPAGHKKVRGVNGRDLNVNRKVWHWGFRDYCRKLIKASHREMTVQETKMLLDFLEGRRG
jgi:hypothetical protein